MPGNKRLGAGASTQGTSRRGLLERDYLKRRPNDVLVVESDASCVPTLLREHAFIVETGLWNAREPTWIGLAEALRRELEEGCANRRGSGEKNY
ncbi:hypothetical protein [Caballeronia glebae]|uniref:hypothetical protein n=1 Tax=Caballeronia glebae TaxID=1777143 RepID=UPI0038BCB4CA